MLEETPTNIPRLLGREKQTKKTGAHGRRKEDAEKKTDAHGRRKENTENLRERGTRKRSSGLDR